MTDARCQRCQEKKVGISDIIRAGHGDRYQVDIFPLLLFLDTVLSLPQLAWD
jgi:hypothetical protein